MVSIKKKKCPRYELRIEDAYIKRVNIVEVFKQKSDNVTPRSEHNGLAKRSIPKKHQSAERQKDFVTNKENVMD